MNRRDFFKAGVAASAAAALPVKVEATEKTRPPLQDAPLKLHTNRMERYEAYRTIMNDNFELNDKIQKIAGKAAKRISDFSGDNMLTIGDMNANNFKHGEINFVAGRTSHVYLRNLYRAYNLAVYGDGFYELIYAADYPSDVHYARAGEWAYVRRPILAQELPADTMYRIETIKGNVLEYQQSKTGVDYAALSKPLDEVFFGQGSTAIRFRPDQIYHLRIGSPIFQPYGVSLLEVVRKNPDARIGEGAIENFFTMFEEGMQDLKDLCK